MCQVLAALRRPKGRTARAGRLRALTHCVWLWQAPLDLACGAAGRMVEGCCAPAAGLPLDTMHPERVQRGDHVMWLAVVGAPHGVRCQLLVRAAHERA